MKKYELLANQLRLQIEKGAYFGESEQRFRSYPITC